MKGQEERAILGKKMFQVEEQNEQRHGGVTGGLEEQCGGPMGRQETACVDTQDLNNLDT